MSTDSRSDPRPTSLLMSLLTPTKANRVYDIIQCIASGTPGYDDADAVIDVFRALLDDNVPSPEPRAYLDMDAVERELADNPAFGTLEYDVHTNAWLRNGLRIDEPGTVGSPTGKATVTEKQKAPEV